MTRLLDQADLPEYVVHPNSPNADDWDADVRPLDLSRDDIIRLAGRGDRAALDVIASCMECNGEIALFDGMSDDERAEAYFYYAENPIAFNLDDAIGFALIRLRDSINARCDAELRAGRFRYFTARRELGQRFRRLREALLRPE